jgi:hypothetical protein
MFKEVVRYRGIKTMVFPINYISPEAVIELAANFEIILIQYLCPVPTRSQFVYILQLLTTISGWGLPNDHDNK